METKLNRYSYADQRTNLTVVPKTTYYYMVSWHCSFFELDWIYTLGSWQIEAKRDKLLRRNLQFVQARTGYRRSSQCGRSAFA